jgi:hypothetical protein
VIRGGDELRQPRQIRIYIVCALKIQVAIAHVILVGRMACHIITPKGEKTAQERLCQIAVKIQHFLAAGGSGLLRKHFCKSTLGKMCNHHDISHQALDLDGSGLLSSDEFCASIKKLVRALHSIQVTPQLFQPRQSQRDGPCRLCPRQYKGNISIYIYTCQYTGTSLCPTSTPTGGEGGRV